MKILILLLPLTLIACQPKSNNSSQNAAPPVAGDTNKNAQANEKQIVAPLVEQKAQSTSGTKHQFLNDKLIETGSFHRCQYTLFKNFPFDGLIQGTIHAFAPFKGQDMREEINFYFTADSLPLQEESMYTRNWEVPHLDTASITTSRYVSENLYVKNNVKAKDGKHSLSQSSAVIEIDPSLTLIKSAKVRKTGVDKLGNKVEEQFTCIF